MKTLIYVNKEKDPLGVNVKKLFGLCVSAGFETKIIDDDYLKTTDCADALFVLGGDGTILCTTEFANKNGIPVIGINVGKLGFLTEYELCDMDKAVFALRNGLLYKDCRTTIIANYCDKEYYALNDVVIQRDHIEKPSNRIVNIGVDINDKKVDEYIGEGILITTPTGSTAYSFSAGGPIIAPGTQAFGLTPIAAHSFNNRPIIFSNENVCKMTLLNNASAGVFVDGCFIGEMLKGHNISVYKSNKPTVFLRNEGYDFYTVLFKKFRDSSYRK